MKQSQRMSAVEAVGREVLNSIPGRKLMSGFLSDI
jgi:hypothetical protein